MITNGFSLCPGPISAVMSTLLSSVTLFNPVTTIVCFRCYRRIAARVISCGRYDAQERDNKGTSLTNSLTQQSNTRSVTTTVVRSSTAGYLSTTR
ncbi:hypothetical protein Ddc_17121 [Ditylenchus destructor]|nr:hypothetical protein Ddc_17121 [Ditylenchus destructor]